MEPQLQTDVLSYNKQKGKRVKHRDCNIINSFRFSQNEFYIVQKDNYFYVCYSVKGELISLWKVKKNEMSASEAVSIFRKGYIKNKITQKDIDEFIEDPLGYNEKRKV